MADRSKAAASDGTIYINEIRTGRARFQVLGISPLISNRVSEKAMHELALPGPKKNAADRASTLKHDPIAEFRASPYLSEDPESDTHLIAPTMWFKNAMKSAALDLPGTTKTQIGRLCWVESEYVPIWGTPKLLMSVVRSADINHTPDIRTRAIVQKWATVIELNWAEPLLNQSSIANLLHAAGIFSGVGDWRSQKGGGSYGQFRLVNEDDPEFMAVVKGGGYDVQAAAMAEPTAYDRESTDLLAWMQGEIAKRGKTAMK